jgi:competence protein ComEC
MKNTGSEVKPAIKIAFLDVGQGDSIVVTCPETREAIVVDCVDANAVLEYLEQERILYLRAVVITHLHADHYCGVPTLLEHLSLLPDFHASELIVCYNDVLSQRYLQALIQNENLHLEQQNLALTQDEDLHSSIIPDERKNTSLQNLINWRAQNKSRYATFQFQAGSPPFKTEFPTGGIKIVHPYSADFSILETKGLNNTSIVLHVTGPNSSALLTGDLEPAGWRYLQENHPDDLHSDILKFPHHGGKWDATNTASLLDAVQPSVVVISVGTEGEKYKHPNKEVFDVLASPPYSHIRVLCTQATKQCQKTVRDQKKSVIEWLDRQANTSGYELIGSKRGCPCAGTVIAELGERACVFQPTSIFHQEKIIRPHFYAHKCTI